MNLNVATEGNTHISEIVPLLLANGQRMFYGTKRKRNLDNIFLMINLLQRKRQKRERIVGYTDLISRYCIDDFKSHFRMYRCTMEVVINSVGAHMSKATTGRPQENVELQCLVIIWVLANQECYRSVADRFNIAKSTVFHFLSRVSSSLNELAETVIKWPTEIEALIIMKAFKKMKSFPGVIGAVDGSHIEIKPPKESAAAYVNRKGRSSMILQAICNHKCLFTDCFVGFPGSVHDARVFQKSGLLAKCNDDTYFPRNSHLLGDSAYPNGLHILAPYKDNGHLTRKQIIYNVAHASTRVVIERAFGILKGRWRRLRYLELHHTNNLPATITAACVLHNICITNNDDLSEEEIIHEEYTGGVMQTWDIEETNNGIEKRDFIANNL